MIVTPSILKKSSWLIAALAAIIGALVGAIALSRPANSTPVDAVLDTPVHVRTAIARFDDGLSATRVAARRDDDLAAMRTFRPGYAFWQNIFTIPDGRIAFGSAADGRLLAVFPAGGDWHRQARWVDGSLATLLDGHTLPKSLDERRDYVAALLEKRVGPVLHNPTRGRFLQPNVERYAPFLAEWGAIYERFGVPPEVGLAQAVLESGLNGTRRSEADAIGFCQWLRNNWKHLDRLAPDVIEAHNQTTQAAYCAAYLSVLATKYGSYIPALSAHHAGNTNVGRVLINGERLGADDTREQYFLGAQVARDLRLIAPKRYSDIYSSYGPRSYRYAEMVFGNTFTVLDMIETTVQAPIYAMRTARAITLDEITRRTGLSADEVRRYNPALVKKVPANATLFLPENVREFGRNVTFWHRPAPAAFDAVLNDFIRLDVSPEEWDARAFEPVLRKFQSRFAATDSEEGSVMATMLAHVIDGSMVARRRILDEFRHSPEIRRLFSEARREWDSARQAN